MKLIAVLVIVCILALGLLPQVTAQTVDSHRLSVCATPLPVVAGAAIGAGFVNFCVQYPQSVQPGATVYVSAQLTAPATVLPIFTAASAVYTAGVGCTENTPSAVTPTTNGVYGTQWTALTTFTMSAGSEYCTFAAVATLTIAALPLQVYSTALYLQVDTENVRLDNFNYLCDAPGIAPNAYSTTTTTCNNPAFQLCGDITCTSNPVVEVQISGDLAICPPSDPCFIESNSTVNINLGNVSINATGGASSNGTISLTQEPSLFILMLTVVAVLAHLGELRRDNQYRIAAGFLLIFTALIPYWNDESQLIGLDHVAFDFTLLLTGGLWVLAAYLMHPKDYTETGEN